MAEQQQQETPKKTYRGNCHCGAYVFEVQLPEIKSANQCNCSICSKKSVLYQFPAALDDLRFVKGEMDTLASYAFGRKLIHHKFCPNCGTAIMAIGHVTPPEPGEDKPPQIAVNSRAVQDLDIWSLELIPLDGTSFGNAYQPPKYTGPEPMAEVEGGKMYTGSCHCGAVTLAIKTRPFDKDFKERVGECNCSICVRNGYTWIYPKKEQVVIEGKENLKYYLMGHRVVEKSFCKTCGIPIHAQTANFSEEQLAAMSEQVRKWAEGARPLCPLNLKVLDEVDLSQLNINKFDGWNKIQPAYVNP